MLQVIVRYKVRPERVAENEQLARAVCEELNASAPDELRYAAFQLCDDVSFVHVAVMAEGRNPLAQVAAFQRFKQGLADRCDEPPVRSEARLVGSFRAFS